MARPVDTTITDSIKQHLHVLVTTNETVTALLEAGLMLREQGSTEIGYFYEAQWDEKTTKTRWQPVLELRVGYMSAPYDAWKTNMPTHVPTVEMRWGDDSSWSKPSRLVRYTQKGLEAFLGRVGPAFSKLLEELPTRSQRIRDELVRDNLSDDLNGILAEVNSDHIMDIRVSRDGKETHISLRDITLEHTDRAKVTSVVNQIEQLLTQLEEHGE